MEKVWHNHMQKLYRFLILVSDFQSKGTLCSVEKHLPSMCKTLSSIPNTEENTHTCTHEPNLSAEQMNLFRS